MSKGRFSFLNIIMLVVAAAMLLAGLAGGMYMHLGNRPGPADDTRYLYIEPGNGLIRIAWLAEQEGLVIDQNLFRMFASVRGLASSLKAGEFEVAPHTSLNELLDQIVAGKTHQRRLSVPEGLSSAEIHDLIVATPWLYQDLEEIPAEGSLLPETWHYSRGDRASALVARMQAAQRTFLQEHGLGAFENENDLLTFASIIEKETGVPGERAVVSAVFHNRLKKRMRLQSDPTVIYGITAGRPLDRPILRSDLRASTPYNTYVIKGLPPTPIANPGKDAIKAALAPADVDYLYFVASGDGGHRFARTLKEHERNVALWRKVERSRKQDGES